MFWEVIYVPKFWILQAIFQTTEAMCLLFGWVSILLWHSWSAPNQGLNLHPRFYVCNWQNLSKEIWIFFFADGTHDQFNCTKNHFVLLSRICHPIEVYLHEPNKLFNPQSILMSSWFNKISVLPIFYAGFNFNASVCPKKLYCYWEHFSFNKITIW